jgi:hypothetical protein
MPEALEHDESNHRPPPEYGEQPCGREGARNNLHHRRYRGSAEPRKELQEQAFPAVQSHVEASDEADQQEQHENERDVSEQKFSTGVKRTREGRWLTRRSTAPSGATLVESETTGAFHSGIEVDARRAARGRARFQFVLFRERKAVGPMR